MASFGVFISYRREDSAGHAGRLFDHFAKKLGRDRVFRDVDKIRPGQNFVEAIRDRIHASEVLLILVGPRWLTTADGQGRRRLEDPNDLVRLEIETGLKRGMRVIPVLLPGATIPDAKELPETLVPLSQLNAVEISEVHFERDVGLLIDEVEPSGGSGLHRLVQTKPIHMAIGTTVIAAMLAIGLFWLRPVSWKWGAKAPEITTPGTGDSAPAARMTPEEARLQLSRMSLSYDPETFTNSAREGDATAVSLFLRAGMKPDETSGNYTALELALEQGHVEIAKSLIESGTKVDRALLSVAQKGNQELFQLLMAKKPSPEALAGALYQAASYGHLDLVNQLLEQGVDVNARWGGAVALSGAAYDGRTNVIRLLLARGADVNAVDRGTGGRGETALHYATRSSDPNSLEITNLLLEAGATVNAQDQSGTTPLMNSLEHRDVALLLVSSGANVNTQTRNKQTALMFAAGRHLPEMVEILVDKGADVNEQDDRGWTALMYTAGAIDSVDDTKTIQALIKHRVNMNLQDHDGFTALMLAARAGLNEATRILIRDGADLDKTNGAGETALQLAKEHHHAETAQLLATRVHH